MKKFIRPSLAFGAMLIACGAASGVNAGGGAPVHHHRRHTGHHPALAVEHQSPASEHRPPTAVEPAIPTLKPFLHPGDGGNDGLSRDPEDCDKGCIGGNPG